MEEVHFARLHNEVSLIDDQEAWERLLVVGGPQTLYDQYMKGLVDDYERT